MLIFCNNLTKKQVNPLQNINIFLVRPCRCCFFGGVLCLYSSQDRQHFTLSHYMSVDVWLTIVIIISNRVYTFKNTGKSVYRSTISNNFCNITDKTTSSLVVWTVGTKWMVLSWSGLMKKDSSLFSVSKSQIPITAL